MLRMNDEDWEQIVERKSHSDVEWAKVRALLLLTQSITTLGGQIGGVDNFTGIQRLALAAEWIGDAIKDITKDNVTKLEA